MIVCQHDENPYQFTVILEDMDCGDMEGRTEKELFDECYCKGYDEQKMADVIVTGLLAGV